MPERRKEFFRRVALGSLTALLLLSGCVSDKISPPSDDGGLNSADAVPEAAGQDLYLCAWLWTDMDWHAVDG